MPAKPNTFRAKKNTQDAHEAIRPTSLEFTPAVVQKHLTDEQFKLYRLIWDRFVASQMCPAVYDQTGVEIEAKPERKDPAPQDVPAPRERQGLEVRGVAGAIRQGHERRAGG